MSDYIDACWATEQKPEKEKKKKKKSDDDEWDWPERFWMEEGHNLPGNGYGGFFA